MLCKEDGVAAIPCSSFFDKKQVNDQYVRFAFCKDLESIREAGRRMKQTEEEAIYATTSSQYSE
jgi:aspartate/methionine/tyrosine aminotransferase